VIYKEDKLGPDKYKVSFRSLKEPVNEDVSVICKMFGGGGHANAASCVVDVSVVDSWRCT
jgi:nanoRNase/pAp phosphatase (c-di-AMP/oligoRNAs hydrolase)